MIKLPSVRVEQLETPLRWRSGRAHCGLQLSLLKSEHRKENHSESLSTEKIYKPMPFSYLLRLHELVEKRTQALKSINIRKVKLRSTRLSRNTHKSFTNELKKETSPILQAHLSLIKNGPKVFDGNPFIGYSTRRALSPDKRLFDHGSLIFPSNMESNF